ncbi:MAG: hypothetical protein HFF90_07530 [Oscillibacter sp.]|nr:hypothetical protein [Oscillibacter sp.]
MESQEHKSPRITKVVACIAAFLLLVPMMIFAALPYSGAGAETMVLGSVCVSLEDFNRTYIDSIVTGIVNEYENAGTAIDHVEVANDLEEDDFLWLTAISSTADRQNLNDGDLHSLCETYLPITHSLVSEAREGGAVTTTLRIEIGRPDPEDIMDALGFDEEAKTWAGALFEVLRDSDTLKKYAAYLDAFRPNYGGDISDDDENDIGHGSGHGVSIDISHFVSPNTKNNLDLAAYAVQAYENNWGYVWGTYGNILTESLFAYKLKQYPDGVGKYKDFIRANWVGHRTADCVGLIKGYSWLDASSGTIRYGTNGMPDYGANQMYRSAAIKGPMSTMPEIKGLAVWKSGHIGIYIGNGYVIEAMGTKYGVVRTKVAGRGWQGWCKLPSIKYIED